MDPVTYLFSEVTNSAIVIHWSELIDQDAGGTGVDIDQYEV